jgi:polar amino acid transport system substrate-binding protein
LELFALSRYLLAALALTILNLGQTTAWAQSVLKLTTENYPPFNMEEEGTSKIIGISTDIVREIMARSDVSYSLRFLPWQRAFGLAFNQDDTCVFSTTVTEERKAKFKWIGPLVENNWIFFARADSDIVIDKLDDARQHVVGGYAGDAVALFLEEQGFTLDLASEDRNNPHKLAANRIDLWATGQHLGPYLASQAGVGIKSLFTFSETVMSLACNRSVDDSLVQELNAILDDLRNEGVIEAITAKYS